MNLLYNAFNLYFRVPFVAGNFERYFRAYARQTRRQKWLDCSTNDIRSWPFLQRQISCLVSVSARDMQIALIYTGPGDCCLVRLATASQIGVVWVRRTCLSIDCHALHHASRISPLEGLVCNRNSGM